MPFIHEGKEFSDGLMLQMKNFVAKTSSDIWKAHHTRTQLKLN